MTKIDQFISDLKEVRELRGSDFELDVPLGLLLQIASVKFGVTFEPLAPLAPEEVAEMKVNTGPGLSRPLDKAPYGF
jgi:hypothetical protein